MPFNLSGILAVCHALIRPRIIIPSLMVEDIRALNFAAFYKAGYKGVVLDKDNCLTLPHQDTLIPDLDLVWKDVIHEFGTGNVLVVSNSAGAQHDAGGLAAESVSHHLGVPVLRHSSLKPSRRTTAAISRYFNSLPSPIPDPGHLVIIGDRVFTDIVLANRLGAYSILVTRDWSHTFKSRAAGVAERAAVKLAQQWTTAGTSDPSNNRFIRSVQERRDVVKLGYSGSTWTWTGRALGLGPNSGQHG